MWILITFGLFIIFMTVIVVIGYWYVAKKYYWLQGDPSKKGVEANRHKDARKKS